jgi:hypothetical protein
MIDSFVEVAASVSIQSGQYRRSPRGPRPRLDGSGIPGHTSVTFRTITLLVLVFATSLVSGCASVTVSRDFAPHVDFTAYRTYALRSVPAREGEPRSLIDQRARAALDRGLTAKGLRRVAETESPDLLVISQFDARDRIDVVPYYSAYSGYWGPTTMGGWGWGYGWSPAPYPYIEGTLVVDLVDPKSNNVVWRGRARRTVYNPELSAKEVDEMVDKMLEKFPPDASKSNG